MNRKQNINIKDFATIFGELRFKLKYMIDLNEHLSSNTNLSFI